MRSSNHSRRAEKGPKLRTFIPSELTKSLSSIANVNPRRKNTVDLQIRHTEHEYRVAIPENCVETLRLQSITIDITRRDGRLIWTCGTGGGFPQDGERVSDGGCHHKQTLVRRGRHVAEVEWICAIPSRPSDIRHRCVAVLSESQTHQDLSNWQNQS